MMENWIEYKIADLCEVGRGSSPRPILDERYFVDGKIPWIKIADATASGKYIFETKEHVNEFGASFSRYLEPNSLIIAASGVSLGQIKFLGVKGCIHDGWLYVSNYNTALIDKEYLYYFLIYYSEAFHNYSSGAAIQNINTEILRNTKLKLPSLSIQIKIASILSAYDELIENNKQRIKLLEDMAEEIYKEWFVRLRFPGYEIAKFVDGLPEGWGIVKVKEVTSLIKRGISPTYDENGETFVLNQRCIRDSRINYDLASRQSKIIPEEKFVKYGDILVNSTGEGTLGRVSQIYDQLEGWSVDSHVTIIRPLGKDIIDYLGIALIMKKGIFESLAFGSTGQTELSKVDVGNIYMTLPSIDLQKNFGTLVEPLRNEIILLLQKNKLLQQTRDLLLPRLISGKLTVEHLVEEEERLLVAAEPKPEYK